MGAGQILSQVETFIIVNLSTLFNFFPLNSYFVIIVCPAYVSELLTFLEHLYLNYLQLFTNPHSDVSFIVECCFLC